MIDATTLKAFGNASAAVARLEERLALSPVSQALRSRLCVQEMVALAWIEGHLLDVDALLVNHGRGLRAHRRWGYFFAHPFGRPLSSGRPPAPKALLDWLGVGEGSFVADDPRLDALIPHRSRAEVLERCVAWAERVVNTYSLPRLLAGAELASVWMAVAPLVRSNAVAAVMIGDRWSLGRTALSGGGFVAIGLHHAHRHWTALSGPDRTNAWLQAVIRAVQATLEIERRLALLQQRTELQLVQRRSTSRLGELMALAMAHPSITLAFAASKLGLSRQGANALITQACAASLLREISGGASFRRYAVV